MKTLKELKQKSLQYTGWSDKEGNPVMKHVFTLDEFDIFCEQLCKEQRHECQIEIDKDSYRDEIGKWFVSCEDILNAKMPNL